MGLLAPVLGTDLDDRSPMGDFWYSPVSRVAPGGPVDPESALTIPQFYAAVTYVAEDIGKLPLNILEDLGSERATGRPRGTRYAADHPVQDLLHNKPNPWQTAIEWKEMVTAWAMLRGKSISEIRPGRRGAVDSVVPLHPDLVREESSSTGEKKYLYRDPKRGGDERPLLRDEVFIVRGRQSRSVLDFAAANLSTTIAAERYAGFMFRRGARHQGVIQAKGRLPDPVRTSLRKALDEYQIDGPRAGRPLLLEDGMEWHDVSMTVKDSQLVELKAVSIADACRWIRIPPHKVFDLSRSTNNNIESQGIDYVVDCLLAWAVRWEQAVWSDLIVPEADGARLYFARLLLDGLLRGDNESRSKAYSLAIMWGWMTRNEVRIKENLNPLDGLDEPLTPANMTVDPGGDTRVGFAPQGLVAAQGPIEGDARRLLQLYAGDAASRAVRREMAAVSKLAERTGGDQAAFRVGLEALYAEHADHLARTLHIPRHEAARYARAQRASLLERGPDALDEWMVDGVAKLTDLAMDQSELQGVAA